MNSDKVDPSHILWLGETVGFWIQTGAIFISAISAIFILYTNSHQSKKRATVDLILHNNTNSQLTIARKEIAKMYLQGINFSKYAAADLSIHPENDYILPTVNNYEFIATGIKEGALDEEIYRRMHRSLLIRDWDGLSGWIMELRRQTGICTLFKEFECLAYKWKKKSISPEANYWRRIIKFLGL